MNTVLEEVNYETMGQFFFGEFSAIWILCLFLCPFRKFPSGHLTRHNGRVLRFRVYYLKSQDWPLDPNGLT